MTLLADLLTGKENTNFILIQDTPEHTGFNFLKAVVSSSARRFDVCDVYCCLNSPSKIQLGLDQELHERIKLIDSFSDAFEWDESSTSNVSMKNVISSHCESRLKQLDRNSSICIVLDCITPFVLHYGMEATYSFLHKLKKLSSDGSFQNLMVVCSILRDAHPSDVVSWFEHLSTTSISMHQQKRHCHVLHKRRSGKLLKKRFKYTIAPNFTFQNINESIGHENIQALEDTCTDPTDNLPFKLTLTEREKDARGELVLPYTRQQKAESKSTGKIYYEPDAADDWDEEDPDDDLDI